MAKQNTADIGFEKEIWKAADLLRGNLDASEYKSVVLGLIFLKYISDKFETKYQELVNNGEGFEEDRDEYMADNIFFVPQEARWSVVAKAAHTPEIGTIIDNAMRLIEKENLRLKGILPKNFARPELDKRRLGDVVDLFTNIQMKEHGDSKDILGRTYEYCLSKFAEAEGKLAGEFYTPACIVQTLVEVLKPYHGRVYDPACGSGGMFVQSAKFIERHQGNIKDISVYGQDSNPTTWKMAQMNLAIRGIEADLGKFNADTFFDDQHPTLKADFIMANPPFNLKDWRGEKELLNDARWKGYKVPPASNANYAWILHMLSKLDVTDGVAGFLLANGALNADGVEYEIRKQLIENDKVEAIIVLPRDMFYTTDISVTLWILNNNKKGGLKNGHQYRNREHEILFCDLRRWDDHIEQYIVEKGKKKKKTVLTDKQIADVKAIYHSWQTGEGYEDVAELCKSASLEEIRKANYSLAPSKYVEFIDHDLEIDYEKEMARIQAEMKEVLSLEKASQASLEEAFKGIGYEI